MAALEYVERPEYSALLVRKTFPDLSQPGGLIARSHEWLVGTDAKWNEQRKQWKFPSGATLQFGYLDGPSDHYRYQGGEFQFIGIDEAQQIPFDQLQYLTTRLRRPACSEIPLRFRLTANPGGLAHDSLKERYMGEPHPDRRFIPSLLKDNPYLDQDSYTKQLETLDPVTRAQLLEGDWDAIATGTFCSWEHFRTTDRIPQFVRYFRGWDIGLTLGGDYTASVLMARTASAFYVLDVQRVKLETPSIKNLILETAAKDPPGTVIGIESTTASLSLVQDLKLNGSFEVRPDVSVTSKDLITVPLGTKRPYLIPVKVAGRDKLSRVSGFLNRLVDGEVVLKVAEWNHNYTREFCLFSNLPSNTDDQIDATSIAFILAMKTRGAITVSTEVAPYSEEWFNRLREDTKSRAMVKDIY